MPAVLNNVATQDTYTDALTVLFQRPRKAFTLNVFNRAVFYQLGFVEDLYRFTGEVTWEPLEHHLVPSFTSFRDVVAENGPANGAFAGVRVRSAIEQDPARVTVA